MLDRSSAYRTDADLASILDDACDWKLTGRHRLVLGHAESLRDAVEMARTVVRQGSWVVAMTREPARDIVVFSAQIQSLEKAMRGAPVHELE